MKMDPGNDELVRKIAQEVIRVLKERGVTPGGGASVSGHQAAAHIMPPIGQCTGDYSKFPELAGRLYGKASEGAAGAVTADESVIAARSGAGGAVPAASPEVVLTGIVTHAMLQGALLQRRDGVVSLAHDARLTPMANDLTRQSAGRVVRLAAGATAAGGGASAKAQELPWLWWIQGSCPVVRDVVGQRSARLRGVGAGQVEGQLGKVVREMAGSIRARQAAGGLMFVPTGAKAVCFANRCASIRAILGTCGEAVEQGIKELGANVLIVEYPHHGYRSVTAMVDRMMQQAPAGLPAVERELSDLSKCG